MGGSVSLAATLTLANTIRTSGPCGTAWLKTPVASLALSQSPLYAVPDSFGNGRVCGQDSAGDRALNRIAGARLPRRRGNHAELPQEVIHPVHVGLNRFLEFEIQAGRDGDVVMILQPMRRMDRDMNAVAWAQQERVRARLQFRLVAG